MFLGRNICEPGGLVLYDRFLFVGLGGAGGSTLGYLKNNIRKWLQENDAGSEIPAGWQFLHIDTPALREYVQEGVDPRLSDDEYLGLIAQGVTFDSVAAMIDGNVGLNDEMQTWRVDPTGLPVAISRSAGQFRAVGATLAVAHAPMIRSRIERSLARLNRSDANSELAKVYHQVTGERRPGTSSSLRVIVVSSLCGGTGAGLLQTVSDISRSLDHGGHEIAFLYTAEVFDSLGAASTGGVSPNSLAAISEFLNGSWRDHHFDGSRPPLERFSLVRAGLPQALSRSGPDLPFLVGRVNTSGVEYDTPDQVFEATGQVLASLVTDLRLQRDLIAYQLSSWAHQQQAHVMGRGTLVDEGNVDERGFPVFMAAGFARLSTGADYFEAYAARRLVREALVDVTTVWADGETAGVLLEQLGLDQDLAGPPQHEFTLISPVEYPTLFESMLDGSDSAGLAEELREAIRELVQGEDPLGESPPDLVDDLRAAIGGLEDRAGQWLRRPGTVFGDYLATSLRSYLAPTGLFDADRVGKQEYQQRQNRFAEQWTAALKAAQPLVKLDQRILGIVHPVPETVRAQTILSQVPFYGHPVMEQAKVALRVLGMSDQVVDDRFTADDKIRHVDINTMLGAPHSVLAFESLLRPIADSWARYTEMGMEQSFWSRRRARTIAEFTPAPQALVHCMVRGWLTGVLLGRIDRQPSGGGPVTIARADNTPAEFPHPFLSVGAGIRDRLPQVLESLAVAYLGVSRTGTLRPLDAYCELRDLGRSQPDAGLYDYPFLHPDLERWIDTGEITGLAAKPLLSASEDASPRERTRILVELLGASLEDYQGDYDDVRTQWERDPTSLSGPPLWTGIAMMLFREIDQLLRAAQRYEDSLNAVHEPL